MNEWIGRLAREATAPLIDMGVRLGKKVALFSLALLALLVAAIFLTIALDLWLATLYGPIIAALAVAGGFIAIAVAAILIASFGLRGGPRKGDAEDAAAAQTTEFAALIDQLAAPALALLREAGLKREQMAVFAGATLARQLPPMTLLALTILAGFILGRIFGRPTAPAPEPADPQNG